MLLPIEELPIFNLVDVRFYKSGKAHTMNHIKRVYNNAGRIVSTTDYGKDDHTCNILGVSVLLHDIFREFDDHHILADEWLEEDSEGYCGVLKTYMSFTDRDIEIVRIAIRCHRSSDKYWYDNFKTFTKEWSKEDYDRGFIIVQVLRDADKLDATGLIGLARTMAYSLDHGRVLHDPEISPKAVYDGESLTAINHITEKLVKISDNLELSINDRDCEFLKEFVLLVCKYYPDTKVL